jgi:hypothetical protein
LRVNNLPLKLRARSVKVPPISTAKRAVSDMQ